MIDTAVLTLAISVRVTTLSVRMTFSASSILELLSPSELLQGIGRHNDFKL